MGWREWLGMKPRIEGFASMLLETFEHAGKSGWTFDRKECVLRHEEGSMINLANIYLEYAKASRSQRRALLEKYAVLSQVSQRPIPALWELAAKSIYLVVRLRFDRTVTEIQTRGETDAPWPPILQWPWLGDLEIRVAYDWGQHLSQVQASLAETWGQPHEAIRARALQNLSALPKPTWRELGSGVYRLETETSYQESLLLVDKVVNLLPFSNSVVCIPSNRGVLLAADRNAQQSLIAMFDEAIQNQQSKPWPLAGTAVERVSGIWHLFLPQEGELAARAGDLQRIGEAITYNDQKAMLEALYEKTKTDIFVATYGVVRRERDRNAIRSWCSWAEGVHSSLPKTDLIVFGREGPEGKCAPIYVPWERAVSLLGRYMTDAGESPPRYFVNRSFSDAEWVALTGEGVS